MGLVDANQNRRTDQQNELHVWRIHIMGYRVVTWPMTSRDPKGAGGSTIGYVATAWLLVWYTENTAEHLFDTKHMQVSKFDQGS